MTLLLEYWKPVLGYEGLYEVSNTGRIRGLIADTVIKQRVGKRGYAFVSLSKCDYRTHSLVHLIVAGAFLGPLPDSSEVVHEDGWRMNNRPSNLKHISAQEAGDKRLAERREYARLYFHRNRKRIRALAAPRAERRRANQRRYYLKNKAEIRAKNDAYRKRNREKRNERERRWRAEHPEAAKALNAHRKQRRLSSPHTRMRRMVMNAKWRAKAAGAGFDLAPFEPILASPPANCSCCANTLEYAAIKTPRSPTIDRIHNDFGYITGNVAVICFRCNLLKKNGTEFEFEQILAYMRGTPRPAGAGPDSSLPKVFWRNLD